MRDFEIPAWLYGPLKIALLIGFTIPFFLWGSELLEAGRSVEQELVTGAAKEFRLVQAEITPGVAITDQNGGKLAESTFGIDVSHYQGVVNWDKVVKTGHRFAFAKATGGITYTDPMFAQNWHGIRAVGMIRGAYHFFYAADDPQQQAAHYLSTVGKLRDFDFPPVLDVEISDHVQPQVLLSGVLTWLKTVEKVTGRQPIIYTDNGFADTILTDARLAQYPLWIADYVTKIDKLPKPWQQRDWSLWQYSATGRVDGVSGDVDLNRFHGGLAEMTTFISESKR